MLAGDLLVQLDVPVADAPDELVGHLRNLLSGLPLETVVHQPFADKLLRQLTLRLAFRKTFLVTVGIEVARTVRRMDLVDQVDLAVLLAEFVFRVDQDQAALGSHLASAIEQRQRVFFEHFVIGLRDQPFGDDLLFRNILVVFADLGFGRRRDDRVRETLVFAHSVRNGHAADLPGAGLVIPPRTAGQVSAHDHLDRERVAAVADRHHRVGRSDFPVRADVGRGVEEFRRDLVQHLSFVRNPFRQDDVERRNPVAHDHHQILVVDIVDITYLSFIQALLPVKPEIGFYDCFCHVCFDLYVSSHSFSELPACRSKASTMCFTSR